MTARLYDDAGRMLGPHERPFTVEQADAIARRDGSLLVSASAGSGKTSVLVERFVRSVLEDGVEPAAILAITFTDKAAGELRARVRGRLVELGHRRAAQDAEAAWVSTIHGFCARVLRANSVAAGLDPGFTVLDDPSARELREAAFEQALAGFLDGGPAARPEALDLVAAYRADRLRTMILDTHATLRSAGQTEPRLPVPPPIPYPGAERAELRAACADALAAVSAAAPGSAIDAATDRITSCADLLDTLEPEALPDAARLAAAGFRPGNTAALRSEPVARFLAARAAFEARCRDRRAIPALALVAELLERHATAYAALKRERAQVDYDDLELSVRDLFVASPATASSYAERFARVMVDEFQDTNRLQLELIGLLDRDDVFCVGDELQSIYGFRHASVEAFRERHDELDRAGRSAALAVSFRARAAILDVLNAGPGRLHERYAPLVAGRQEPPSEEPLVELLVTDAEGWEDDPGLPSSQPARCAEARAVAARVAELVAGGAHAAGDVVVLLRAAGDMATFEGALQDAGLATLASGGRGFWARQQVQDLCSYLAALVNPRDEAALLGVLASPIGAHASSDALALLAMAAKGSDRPLWAVLRDDDPAQWAACLPAGERSRLADFAVIFAAERTRAPRLGLDALLERAIERSAYDEHVLRLPGGARRLANVAKLVRLASAFEAERGRDVRAFIDRATGELEAEAREPDAPVELAGEDAVRLMTVHAAKGLEFGVVVVADLGRPPNHTTPDLLVDADRVGLRLVGMDGASAPALEHEALATERVAEEEREERRVFHVAMTRAEERLILSGTVKVASWPRPRGPGPPLVWLGPTLVEDLPRRLAACEEPLVAGGVRCVLNRPAAPLRVEAARPPATTPPLFVGGGVPAPASAPAAPRARAPAALSYSTLRGHAACGYRFYLERILRLPAQDPPASESSDPAAGLDPMLRGTLAHELLEHADLAASAPGPEAVRARGALHGVELDDEAVDDLRTMVGAALEGPLLERVRAARAVHRERTFALALGPGADAPLLNGVVDVLALEADGAALVVDYKTDHLDGQDPESVVAAGYGAQRRIYALAALRAGAPRVEVAHLFLERPEAPAVARFAAADADRLQAEVAALAAGLLAAYYPVAATPHRELCGTCPGRGGLCSWPEEMTLRPAPGG